MIKPKRLHCSFCGKNETEVLKLVAGPRVYICDECVAIASRMMENDSNNRGPETKAERSFCRKVAACVRELLRAGRKRGANLVRVSG